MITKQQVMKKILTIDLQELRDIIERECTIKIGVFGAYLDSDALMEKIEESAEVKVIEE